MIQFTDPCPVCGRTVVLHCSAPNKCGWWKCEDPNCKSYGNDKRYYNGQLERAFEQ